MRQAIIISLLFLTINLYADETKFGYRIRYERTQGEDSFTGFGSSAGIDLTAQGIPGNNHLITAWHVVETADEIFAQINKHWVVCKVIKKEMEFDIAILEAEVEVPDRLVLSDSEPAVGDKLNCIGCPHGFKDIIEMKGELIQTYDPEMGNPILWRIKAPQFTQGGSGGGVIFKGKLYGIAVATTRRVTVNADGTSTAILAQDVALMLPLKRIKQFLADKD